MPGHLRATCPAPAAPSAGSATGDVEQLFQQQIDAVLKLYNARMKQAKKEDQQKEEDILVMESAEPLPIVHDDGCLRWQNKCATNSTDYFACPTTSVGIGACALGRTGST